MSVLNKFALTGKVAIITGSGKGIGAEIARVFASAGADVVLAARTESDLKAVAAEVEAMGRRVLIVVLMYWYSTSYKRWQIKQWRSLVAWIFW